MVLFQGLQNPLPRTIFIGKDELQLRWFRSNPDGGQDVVKRLRGFSGGKVFPAF